MFVIVKAFLGVGRAWSAGLWPAEHSHTVDVLIGAAVHALLGCEVVHAQYRVIGKLRIPQTQCSQLKCI